MRIGHRTIACTIFRCPLMCSGRTLRQFPFVAEQVGEEVGAVPILGDLLVSKKGEGIFGLTYAMKGNLNEPSLSVNPLSVLTPGIFRRIFEFATPKEPTPVPQPQPQPQATVEAAPETAPTAPQ